MSKFLKLIRIQNLLFIVFIQYAMRFFIVKPILENYNLSVLFSDFHFLLLVLTTVLLAAAGYIINDYFDYELDKKAGKKIVIGNGISKKKAINIYTAFVLIALAIGFFISFKMGIYKLGFIYVIVAGLLWFYSTSFKKMFLVGNVIVALVSALVPFIVALYEIPLQYSINKEILVSRGQNLNEMIVWLAGFAGFAFLLTLLREIIKDSEDMEGDMAFNANTLSIILGEKNTKLVVSLLALITIGGAIFLLIIFLNDIASILYISVLIILPLFFLIVKNFKAKTSENFHFLSTFTKLIMIAGVFYSIVAYFNF